MFNFSNLESLLTVKWNTLFKDYVPKDTSSLITKEDYQDILSGGLLSLISHVLLIIINIVLTSKISDSIVLSMSFINFIPIILTMIIIGYYINIYNKNLKTNGTINYVVLIITVIYTLCMIIYLIPWLRLFSKSFILTLLAIIFILSIILSNLFILSGVIGYGNIINEEYEEVHKDRIIHPNIEVTRIDINDVSDHSFKYCSRCGERNSKDSNVCSKCGNML